MKPARTHTKQLLTTLILSLVLVSKAQASTINLVADGEWNEFNVDDFSSISQGVEWIDLNNSNSPNFGSPLSYQFTISNGFKGLLSVVDAGFAGDRFEILNNGQGIGLTSASNNSTDYSNNFAANLNNVNFSNGLFELTEGTYNISGALFSTLQPFNATNGALKLEVTTVPLPGSYGLFLGGLSLLTFVRRRQAKSRTL
jgi:hypothetical protein